jgi:hypothetical protein
MCAIRIAYYWKIHFFLHTVLFQTHIYHTMAQRAHAPISVRTYCEIKGIECPLQDQLPGFLLCPLVSCNVISMSLLVAQNCMSKNEIKF